MSATIVVAGAGEAGCQAAASLREARFDGRIVLLGDEGTLPYQRPPLSKGHLAGTSTADDLWLRRREYYEQQAVELRPADPLVAIDPAARTATVGSGDVIPYDHLVLALGSRSRTLPVPGVDLQGVVSLRTLPDADRLADLLSRATDIVVIGGGFIGLEVAATAVRGGRRVTVVEVAPRLLHRTLSPVTSAHLMDVHQARGVVVELGAQVREIEGLHGAVTGVRLGDGRHVRAELVVIGVGAAPNVEPAVAAGLTTGDGIEVDAFLRTSDPHISAVGDCALAPNRYVGGARVRLESVQNAKAQARCVATGIATGRWQRFDAVPWFWSNQGDLRLQIAGLIAGTEHTVRCGVSDGDRFSIACFDEDELLIGVESVNNPSDHLAARRLLAGPRWITRALVEDCGDLGSLARREDRSTSAGPAADRAPAAAHAPRASVASEWFI